MTSDLPPGWNSPASTGQAAPIMTQNTQEHTIWVYAGFWWRVFAFTLDYVFFNIIGFFVGLALKPSAIYNGTSSLCLALKVTSQALQMLPALCRMVPPFWCPTFRPQACISFLLSCFFSSPATVYSSKRLLTVARLV